MPRRPAHRLTIALIAVWSLLFSQWALATYVCPTETDPAMAEMLASGQPCDEMDAAQPALCHEHGAATAQSSGATALPVLTLPLTVQVLALPPAPLAGDVVQSIATGVAEARPPPDPLFLSTHRLRV